MEEFPWDVSRVDSGYNLLGLLLTQPPERPLMRLRILRAGPQCRVCHDTVCCDTEPRVFTMRFASPNFIVHGSLGVMMHSDQSACVLCFAKIPQSTLHSLLRRVWARISLGHSPGPRGQIECSMNYTNGFFCICWVRSTALFACSSPKQTIYVTVSVRAVCVYWTEAALDNT